jgi:hypothetical protein
MQQSFPAVLVKETLDEALLFARRLLEGGGPDQIALQAGLPLALTAAAASRG